MVAGRRLALVLGLAAAGLGLAVVVRPGLASGVEPTSVVVLLVGALAFVLGANAVLDRVRSGAEQADLPAVERRLGLPAPGRAFDDRLAEVAARGRMAGAEDRAAVHDRLEAVAVDVLVRHGGVDGRQARERLRRGTWTDDPHAAAFFGDDPGAPEGLLRRALRGEPAFRRQVRHVVAELDARVHGDRGRGDSDERRDRGERRSEGERWGEGDLAADGGCGP